MDKLKYIKIKQEDGTYSEEVPVGVDASNVDMSDGRTLPETLGLIDVDANGTVKQQLDELNKNKVDKDVYNTFVDDTNKEILKKVNQSDYDSKISEYSDKIKNLDTTDEILSARMDNFTSLPEGSTEGNAELVDIRVGIDGTNYSSAGNAVREQFKKIVSFDETGNSFIKEGSVIDKSIDKETMFKLKTQTVIPCQIINWEDRITRLPTLVQFNPIKYPGDGSFFPNPYIKNSQNGRIFIRFTFLNKDKEIIKITSKGGTSVNFIRIQNTRVLVISKNTIQSKYYYDISDYENNFLYNKGSVDEYTFEGEIAYIQFEIDADFAFDAAKYGVTFNKPSYEYIDYPYKKVTFNPLETFGVMEQTEEYLKENILNTSELQRMLKTFIIRENNSNRDVLRIGTFNIYVGRSGYNWPRIKEELQDFGIDICAFQEVPDPKGTSRDYNYFTFKDTMTGWQFPYCNDNDVVYEANERMVLSRYEILSSSETVFKTEGNERALLKCEIQLPRYKDYKNGEWKLSIYSTHLSVASEINRLAQVDEMLEIISQDNNPFKVICMDSNDFSKEKPVWSKIENAGFSKAHDGTSMTVTDQSQSIDQIFFTKNMEVIYYNVINSNLYKFSRNGKENPVSDHDLVFADLKLNYDKEGGI